MSVQTDCEMLSVRAMEAYARKYHVSGRAVSYRESIEVFAVGEEEVLCQR